MPLPLGPARNALLLFLLAIPFAAVNYVAFDPHQALPTAAAKAPKADPLADPAHQAVQENPRLEIPDQQGNLVNAGQALDEAGQAVSDAERDSQKAIQAAINLNMALPE